MNVFKNHSRIQDQAGTLYQCALVLYELRQSLLTGILNRQLLPCCRDSSSELRDEGTLLTQMNHSLEMVSRMASSALDEALNAVRMALMGDESVDRSTVEFLLTLASHIHALVEMLRALHLVPAMAQSLPAKKPELSVEKQQGVANQSVVFVHTWDPRDPRGKEPANNTPGNMQESLDDAGAGATLRRSTRVQAARQHQPDETHSPSPQQGQECTLQVSEQVGTTVLEPANPVRRSLRFLHFEPTANNPFYRRPRPNFSRDAVDVLKAWLLENAQDPYPDAPTKVELSKRTGLSLKQVNDWFINGRRRLLQQQQKQELHH